jgi:hypothetical protein
MRNAITFIDYVVVRLAEPARMTCAWVMDRTRVDHGRTGTRGRRRR